MCDVVDTPPGILKHCVPVPQLTVLQDLVPYQQEYVILLLDLSILCVYPCRNR